MDVAHVQEKEAKIKTMLAAKKDLRNVKRYDIPELETLEDEIRDAEQDGESMVKIGRRGSQTLTMEQAKARVIELREIIQGARKEFRDATQELLEFNLSFPEISLYIKQGLPAELLPLWLEGWSLDTFEHCQLFAGPAA